MNVQPTEPLKKPSKVEGLIIKFQESQDSSAQEQLVKIFAPLVNRIANHYSRGRDNYEDLSQVGMLGLLGAMKRFDPTLGTKFESFATPTIIGEIKKFFRDQTWSVNVPRRVKELGYQVEKAVEDLTHTLGRSPRIEDIARKLSISEEEVLEALESKQAYTALSFDSPVEVDNSGNAVTFLDLLGQDDKGFTSLTNRLAIDEAMKALNEREREVIILNFYENLTQQQIGEKLGISQMHVSRLRRRALEKLKQILLK